MEVTDNTKTMANALAEIEQLQQKLEQAEARADKAEAMIREAQEQKPSIFVVFNGVSPVKAFYENSYACEYADSQQKNHSLSGSWSNFHVKGLYAAPVPAMPIQDESKAKSDALFEFANKLEGWLNCQDNRDCADAINNVRIEARNDAIKYRDESEVKPS
jgi:hypothetical protein